MYIPKRSGWLYGLLLWFYPARFRREYGAQMRQVFGDLYRQQARRRAGLWGWVGFWTHILLDTTAAAVVEHYDLAKERTMNLSRPALMLFVPIGLFLLVMMVVFQSLDILLAYGIVFIAGMGVWGLGWIGLIPRNRVWQAYTVGGLVGMGGILLIGLYSNYVLEVGLPGLMMVAISLALYAVCLWAVHHFIGGLGNSFWGMALVMPALAGIASLFSFSTVNVPEVDYLALRYGFSLMQILAILLVGAVSIHQIRRIGRTGALTMMVGCGFTYALFDPGYFGGATYDWVRLMVIIFPLILCPLWWLTARSVPSRIWGTFGLWCAMLAVSYALPILGRVSVGLPAYIPTSLSHILITIPPLVGVMWAVLIHGLFALDEGDTFSAPGPHASPISEPLG